MSPAADRPLRLLLIEDEPADAAWVRLLLQEAMPDAFELQHAMRLATALEDLATETYDGALLDLQLPDSRGLETFQRLHEAAPQLPVLIFSGLADDRLALEAVAAGAQDYHVKGMLTGDALARAIRSAHERGRLNQRQEAEKELLQETLDAVPAAIAVLDRQQHILMVNDAWRALCARQTSRIQGVGLGRPYLDVADELFGLTGDGPYTVASGLRSLERHPDRGLSLELQGRRGDQTQWIMMRASPAQVSGERRIVVTHDDVTGRKQLEQNLRHAALHDSLTGLPNRALFRDRLDHALARYQREPQHRFALLFTDLDQFKPINDRHGHAVGDRVLVETAARLRSCARVGDTVARIGGDEFGLLLEHCPTPAEALHVVKRIQARLREPIRCGEHELYVTACIGVRMPGTSAESVDTILNDADQAMYRGKQRGPSSHAIHEG